jgi:hypothetical protein
LPGATAHLRRSTLAGSAAVVAGAENAAIRAVAVVVVGRRAPSECDATTDDPAVVAAAGVAAKADPAQTTEAAATTSAEPTARADRSMSGSFGKASASARGRRFVTGR